MTPVVYLLCGLPGAGKTHFARDLVASQPNCVRLTLDEMMNRRWGEDPPAGQFKALYEQTLAELWQNCEALLASKQSVVIDTGFWTRQSRNEAKESVFAMNAKPVLIWLNTDPALCKERVLQRSQEVPEDSLYIDEPAFELFRAQFEPPEAGEMAVTVDSTAFNFTG